MNNQDEANIINLINEKSNNELMLEYRLSMHNAKTELGVIENESRRI